VDGGEVVALERVGGGALVVHRRWQMLDCATLELFACSGDSYTQSWSHTPGLFVLQGIELQETDGIFSCGPNDC
jgi:hypothetical protein